MNKFQITRNGGVVLEKETEAKNAYEAIIIYAQRTGAVIIDMWADSDEYAEAAANGITRQGNGIMRAKKC